MRLSRIRVAFQILLHVVLIGHVLAYYWLDWRDVGALDFQSFFHHFLGEGVLTAGAFLALGVYGSALVFGRLFCSWGCHFGATQDFAAWILRRFGWRPPLVRTRILQWFPFAFLGLIFVLPLLRRWLYEPWELRVDMAAVAPWDTLPGWLMSILTFLVCGAAILLFLGTRGFCRFVCPYGALFRVTSRVAPYRVRRIASCSGAQADCSGGGSPVRSVPPCTIACPTAIDVHRETSESGAVVSTDCIRCHLCIEACPQGALAYRARPALPEAGSASTSSGEARSPLRASGPVPAKGVSPRASSSATSLGLPVEMVIAGVTLLTYLIVDLVYGGHFFAACLALGEGFLVYTVLRVVRRRRRGDRWTLSAVTAVGALLLTLVPLFEATAFKLLSYRARLHDPAPAAASSLELAQSPAAAGSDGSVDTASLREAAELYRHALAYFPSHTETLRRLLSVYLRLLDPRAVGIAETLRRLSGNSRQGSELLFWVYLRYGDFERARQLEAAAGLFDG